MGKLNQQSTNRKNIVNIGTALLVVVLIGLSFAVIAALTISSAKNNKDLSENLANHTTEYYEACNKAYQKLNEEGWADKDFEVEISDDQVLKVQVKDGEIVTWQVENNGDWENDESLPVHTKD